MAISTEAFLLVFSVIIFIGFAGSWLLSKKGIPETLFLIAAGTAVRWMGFNARGNEELLRRARGRADCEPELRRPGRESLAEDAVSGRGETAIRRVPVAINLTSDQTEEPHSRHQPARLSRHQSALSGPKGPNEALRSTLAHFMHATGLAARRPNPRVCSPHPLLIVSGNGQVRCSFLAHRFLPAFGFELLSDLKD